MRETILAIETSARWTGVALADGADVIASSQVESRNRHNEVLSGIIDKVMEKGGKEFSDIDLIGVSIGPGSFTALRIGLLVAKGIAFALTLKIVPVMTLDVLNSSWDFEGEARLPVIDAYKGEVFTALYEGKERKTEPVISDPAKLHELVEDRAVHVFGPALKKYRVAIESSLGERLLTPDSEVFPEPGALALLAWERRNQAQDPAGLEPFYLRRPDARPPNSQKDAAR
ncbi:tRNA (adenosine(37)-N6)-threonylcarbamoyltransferase complex dimerization subunit type 1 TsaB [candidate division WOR-3 bacterium]|nr:tRNA (adenosine(37)-N6)-threonylcarbamoyltransferase complex dimerization subunit type 1 TsaB [candidate division WOR-3 bacterium]